MPNASHTFTVNLIVSCSPCHTTADAAAREQTLQAAVQNSLLGLKTRLENWSIATFGSANPDSWDYTTNIPAGEMVPSQSNTVIPIEVKRARHNYYFIIVDRSYGVHNFIYINYLLAWSNQTLNDLPAATPAYTGSVVKSTTLSRQQVRAILNADLQKAMRAGIASGR
jgi:hypothetical protein